MNGKEQERTNEKMGPKEFPQERRRHKLAKKKKATRTYNQKENQKIRRRNIDFKGSVPLRCRHFSRWRHKLAKRKKQIERWSKGSPFSPSVLQIKTTMSWRIWNRHLPIADAVCSWNFNLDLKNSLWRCYVSHSLEWKFGNLNSSRAKLLKKNSPLRTPNQNLNLLSQRHPSKVFFLIQIKRVHATKWSSHSSQYMFPRSNEFFEFACIKLISRCILQINCEEYKHRDCCPKTRWKVVVMRYLLSCILYNDL